jgi:4,5-dihydroxyphthalate decarboxylase
MSEPLTVSLPIMRYDITLPLLEGRVEIPGVKLEQARVPGMIFSEDSPYKTGNFAVGDLNVCYWLPAIEAGWDVIGLPIFIKRKPVYEYVFCRADASIKQPKDLEGKRVGGRQHRVSTTIWLRGLLQHRHGVDISKIHWVIWMDEVFPLHNQSQFILEKPADPQKSVVDALLDGDVDAIMTDISDGQLFHTLEHDPRVVRLFPDYQEDDYQLYKETGMFTAAHLIVMSRKLDREHPELARKLYDAFEQSKAMAYSDVLSDQRGFCMPQLRERFIEAQERWGDAWRNGIRANKYEIDAFLQYNVEQGMIGSPMSYEQIFAAGTLDT